MLDMSLKQQLAGYLQKIVRPVDLTVSVDDSARSRELLELAQEIAAMSPEIALTINQPAQEGRVPLLSIAPAGEKARVEFAGIPMGHEFTSLVLALLQAGGHPSKTEQALLDQIVELDPATELRFETYISLSCHNCPDVVQALNLMAVLNPKISHTMIDGGLFQNEINDRNVMGVPAVFLNDELMAQGKMTLADILDQVDATSAERKAAALADRTPYDVLIVGGGPAGASAAIYAARKGIRTGIVAERFGGQVADTMSIENFISVKETDGPKLVTNLEQHVLSYDVDLMNSQKARRLHAAPLTAEGAPADFIEVELESGVRLKSRSVILATGARWREMNVPGEKMYRGKGVAYCPHCDGPLFKGKRVAVIGGGNSGIEAAIDLAGLVEHVTVLEFSDTLRADEVLLRKARSLGNVTIITEAMTTEVTGDGSRVNGLNYIDRVTQQAHHVELAGIFVQIGLVPNTEWLKGDVDLSERGEIVVDARGQTSLPGVFAAGDVTTVPFKQIIIAMGAGSGAALGAFDYLIRTPVPCTQRKQQDEAA